MTVFNYCPPVLSWLSAVLCGNNAMTTKWNIVFGPETDEKKEGKKTWSSSCVAQLYYPLNSTSIHILVPCAWARKKSVNLTWFWYLNYTLHCELAFQTIELWVEKRKLLLCDNEECGRTRQAKKRSLNTMMTTSGALEAFLGWICFNIEQQQQHVEWGFDI